MYHIYWYVVHLIMAQEAISLIDLTNNFGFRQHLGTMIGDMDYLHIDNVTIIRLSLLGFESIRWTVLNFLLETIDIDYAGTKLSGW